MPHALAPLDAPPDVPAHGVVIKFKGVVVLHSHISVLIRAEVKNVASVDRNNSAAKLAL